MKSTITFDYSYRIQSVMNDRESVNLTEIDVYQCRNLLYGCLYIIFEPQREYIRIESGIIDYMLQIKEVIESFDSGVREMVTVSPDYYNNNIRYTYSPNRGSLELYEMNGGEFRINTNFKLFKREFISFYKEAISDLMLLYPEFKINNSFSCSFLGNS